MSHIVSIEPDYAAMRVVVTVLPQVPLVLVTFTLTEQEAHSMGLLVRAAAEYLRHTREAPLQEQETHELTGSASGGLEIVTGGLFDE